jgi:hypothetical protein
MLIFKFSKTRKSKIKKLPFFLLDGVPLHPFSIEKEERERLEYKTRQDGKREPYRTKTRARKRETH